MKLKHAAVGLFLAPFVACARPAKAPPPEPPVTQTTTAPKPLRPDPAPTTTLPSPLEPPPEVLKVRDDGHG